MPIIKATGYNEQKFIQNVITMIVVVVSTQELMQQAIVNNMEKQVKWSVREYIDHCRKPLDIK